jgi:hypothetical protein
MKEWTNNLAWHFCNYKSKFFVSKAKHGSNSAKARPLALSA